MGLQPEHCIAVTDSEVTRGARMCIQAGALCALCAPCPLPVMPVHPLQLQLSNLRPAILMYSGSHLQLHGSVPGSRSREAVASFSSGHLPGRESMSASFIANAAHGHCRHTCSLVLPSGPCTQALRRRSTQSGADRCAQLRSEHLWR